MLKPSRFVCINEAFQAFHIKHQITICRSLAIKFSEKVLQKSNVEAKPVPKEKLVKIVIIGTSNAGKSTFINNLLRRRICPTSTKVHTTRTSAKAIGIYENCQVIMIDTPGFATEQEMKKYNLTSESIRSYSHSIQDSDLIGVIHDVSARNELHPTVLDTLKEYSHVPSFLVLNKIDLLNTQHEQYKLIRLLTNDKLVPRLHRLRDRYFKGKIENQSEKIVGWPDFKNVFMVSSTKDVGTKSIMTFLLHHTKKTNWEYEYGEHTDQPPEELIVQSVRARLLDSLQQEIAYTLQFQVQFCHFRKGQIIASVQVLCPSKKVERSICGAENDKLKQITKLVTFDLEETFTSRSLKEVLKPVSLTISAITKTNNNT